MKRPQPQPPHAGGTFHRRPKALCTKKHKVSCSGFLPNTSPMQQSCSHYNVFRSITSQTCTYLCTWQHEMTTIMQPFHCDLQPQIQDTHANMHRNNHSLQNTEEEHIHRGGTHSRMKRPQPQPPHTRGTFHRRPKALYTKKHKVSCSGFLPNTSPMQQSCSHYKVTTSQSRHFPSSHFPKVTTLPLSPPFFVTTSLSLTPPFINLNSCVMYCYVMSSLTPPFINVSSV